MRPIVLTASGVAATSVAATNINSDQFNVSFAVVVTGTVTYTVQHTYDDVYASTFNPATATWFPHPTIAAQTATKDGTYTSPIRGLRANLTAGTGSVVFTVLQSGI